MAQLKWTTEKRKINDLIPYSQNPRQMTDKQNKDLTKSLEKFDLVEIPAINTDGTILAGHQRLRIMQQLGRGEEIIDVRVPNRLLTEKEVQEYNIRSNKNTGEFDFDILANAFETEDLLDWGFEESELKIDKIIDEDDVPEAQPQAVSQLGDIYKLGNHRLMCGDSTNLDDIEKLMDGHKADMVFTDPPYNVNYEGKTKDALKIKNDHFTDDSFYQFLLEAFTSMSLHTKAGGAIYVCHADSEGLNFRKAFLDAGYLLKQCIIWNKNCMVMGRQDYQCKHEPILYGWKNGGSHQFFGGRYQTTVWDIDKPTKSLDHPTMKPIALVVKGIENSSKSEDIVLDLFLGSGSTLMACEQTNRVCYGTELDPRYVDVIIKRWEAFTGEKAEKVS